MNKQEEKRTSAALTAARRRELEELSQRLGVGLTHLELLNQALTHTSYANEHPGAMHNERLEFLGDAVLELASSTSLYEEFPDLPEGELTKMRASLVCSESLAALARGLGLGSHLRLGRGEEHDGGRERQTNLEDAFESVIGAIYLDCGFAVAADFVQRELAGGIADLEPFAAQAEGGLSDYSDDAKTHLQEVVFQRCHPDDPGSSIVYEELAETGPDHAKQFEFQVRVLGRVLGTGRGSSKKEAQQQAAREALKNI